MKPLFCCVGLMSWFIGTLCAQGDTTRHRVELGSGGVFPVSGWKADEYAAGPALRLGYELRLHKHLAADAGWTWSWLPGTSCDRFGCTHPREQLRLLDSGLRGIMPLAAGRVELSLGLGGGYIWYDRGSENWFLNSGLLQYSGRATVGVDRRRRFQIGITIRTWRDPGRPTQQWLATTGSFSYSRW